MTSAILRRCLGEDTGWIRPYLSEVANDDWSGLLYSEVRVLPLQFKLGSFLHGGFPAFSRLARSLL